MTNLVKELTQELTQGLTREPTRSPPLIIGSAPPPPEEGIAVGALVAAILED